MVKKNFHLKAIFLQHTTLADRLFMIISALLLLILPLLHHQTPGAWLRIHRPGAIIDTYALNEDRLISVTGLLGVVRVEIKKNKARLQEFRSPRLIGTRTGWIQHQGEHAVCIPCGVLIEIRREDHDHQPSSFDAIAQ
ncbi:NusG domain II-containing protein [Magnetococcales bacterium HHB-1]